MENPMASPLVAEAMELLYGPILEKYTNTKNDPTGLLLQCLASIVHHSDWFISMATENAGHFFGTLTIFQRQELLEQLKPLITKEKLQQIARQTGIPPCIEQAVQLKELVAICANT
jgi:hypothetical protein